MSSNPFLRSLPLLAVMGLVAGCADSSVPPLAPDDLAPAHSREADRSRTIVTWHAQQAAFGNTGTVEGASAHLIRTESGISFWMTTNSLNPGHAYTLWLVTVDNPEECAAKPCTPVEMLTDPDIDAQVRWAAGSVAGNSGNGTFAGSVSTGPLSGWLPDRSFDNPMGAEVHLVINDHGPMLPAFMPGMIQTYRGGCSDESPFPGIFPESALADGEVGPNTCLLFQVAVLMPEE